MSSISQAEVVGDELGGERVLALALEREADPHRDLAEDVEADGGALGHAGALHADDRVGVPVEDAGLDRAHDADADERPFGARLRLLGRAAARSSASASTLSSTAS